MSVGGLLTTTGLRRGLGRCVSDAVNQWCRLRLPTTAPAAPAGTASGALVIASFYARANGVSSGALAQLDALRRIGLQPCEVDATAGIRNPLRRAPAGDDIGAAVAHADGRMVGLVMNYLGRRVRRSFRVGYCAWELAEPPRDWQGFDGILHEVWAPSRFAADALRSICRAPVRVVPHVVRPRAGGGSSLRARLGLRPDDFVVLTMADLRSSLARKNPVGAIEAFRRALGGVPRARLVVKVSGAGHDPLAHRTLTQALRSVQSLVIDTRLSADDQWALLDAADVLVSLHRAEGYGLPLAEAMSLGKPVVATGWSGNLDFMDSRCGVLVGSRLVAIDDPQGIYRDGSWAEPDLDEAADALRQLEADAALRRELGAAAADRFAVDRQLQNFEAALSPAFRAAAPRRTAP